MEEEGAFVCGLIYSGRGLLMWSVGLRRCSPLYTKVRFFKKQKHDLTDSSYIHESEEKMCPANVKLAEKPP